MHKIWIAVVFTGVLFNTLFVSCHVQTAPALFDASDKLEEPYGTVSFFTVGAASTQDKQLDAITKIGMTNIRQDFKFNFQDDTDTTKYNLYDSVFSKNDKLQINNIAVLEAGNKNHRPWNDKRNYISKLNVFVNRYQNDIRYWEFINEINWLRDSTQVYDGLRYCSILPDVYHTIKGISPDNRVLLSGLAGVNVDILKTLCKEKAFNYFDIFNFHAYCEPEKLPEYFQIIRKYMDNYDWDKPVWMTEYGYATNIEKNGALTKEEKEIVQAKYVARAHLISFAHGVEKVFWYSFRSWEADPYDKEQHFGLTHVDVSPKPAYKAYGIFTDMCPSGSSRPVITKSGNIFISEWNKPDGTKVNAVWIPEGQKDIKLKIKGRYKIYDYMGESIKKIETISDGVTFVVGAKSVKINLE